LLRLCSKGVGGTVRVLVELGANVQAQATDGSTLLQQAAAFRFVKSVRVLVELGGDVRAKDAERHTPLHIAAINGKMEMIKLLMEIGGDVRALLDAARLTPLQYAELDSHEAVVVRFL
jgi:ankyrin repeat protein